MQPPQSTDVVLSSLIYEPGPYGEYYQYTGTLYDAGSGNGAELGLYHHTTRREQPIEGNSQADIGFHYVATKGAHYSLGDFSGIQGNAGWYYLYTPALSFGNYQNTNNYLPCFLEYGWWEPFWYGLTGEDYYCMLSKSMQNPGNVSDTLRAFVLPQAGKIKIRNITFSCEEGSGKNGILYRIYKNNETPELLGWKPICNRGDGGQPYAPIFLDTQVQSGDTLYFQLNSNGNNSCDFVGIFQYIFYLDPIDTDNDGLPDYAEDRNGNGQYDPTLGETNWQVADNPLGAGGINGNAIQVFTPLK